jgi:lipopolysaccharide export LptBFGC system permease protein LptF
MRLISSSLHAACGLAVVAMAADPAWAGVAVPGPALGAGLPALALFGAGYWLIRRYRRG